MKRFLGIATAAVLMIAGTRAHAAPGDCFNGGTPPSCSPSPAQQAACTASPTTCSGDDSGCVSDTKDHLKCSAAIGGAFCKLVACVIGCHKKQADQRFKGATADAADAVEDTCEIGPGNGKSCKEKLDTTLSKLAGKGICDPLQLSNAASEEAVLIGHPSPINALSLDAQNGGVYCDSTGGAQFIEDKDCEGGSNNGNDCSADSDCPGGGKCVREDTGFVPNSKSNLICEDALGKELGKLVCCTIKCHTAMNTKFFSGKPFDEEACEETQTGKGCRNKFNKTRDKNVGKGICPACLNSAGWDAQADNAINTVDGANVIVFPCF